MNRSEIIDGVETIQLQHMPHCSNFAIETNDGVPNNTIPVLPIMFCKM